MTTNALSGLEPDVKTAKRAQYEAFEFALEAPGILQVTNGSYGEGEKADHTYRVTVEGGVPVACECPADKYHSGACKHRVAVAIREPVLDAATADRVATDGGGIVVADGEGEVREESEYSEDDRPEDCDCSTLPGDYPCASCYIDGDAEWPDDTEEGVGA